MPISYDYTLLVRAELRSRSPARRRALARSNLKVFLPLYDYSGACEDAFETSLSERGLERAEERLGRAFDRFGDDAVRVFDKTTGRVYF